MAQVVSRRSLTAEARVRARAIHVGFVVDKVALEQVFSEFFGFPLSIYHSTVALQTHIVWGMRNMLAQYANVSRHPRLGTRPTPPSGE
jgi:hypothetical protein